MDWIRKAGMGYAYTAFNRNASTFAAPLQDLGCLYYLILFWIRMLSPSHSCSLRIRVDVLPFAQSGVPPRHLFVLLFRLRHPHGFFAFLQSRVLSVKVTGVPFSI